MKKLTPKQAYDMWMKHQKGRLSSADLEKALQWCIDTKPFGCLTGNSQKDLEAHIRYDLEKMKEKEKIKCPHF